MPDLPIMVQREGTEQAAEAAGEVLILLIQRQMAAEAMEETAQTAEGARGEA